MNVLLYLDASRIRGGIEVFADRQLAELRASGVVASIAHAVPDDFGDWDEIFVHKCSSVAALERFPPEKTTLYVHDHEPLCPRTYAYTPLRRNCARRGGIWPCAFCAPLCRDPVAALRRVMSQKRRVRAMARFHRVVTLSNFMKSRLVANGIPAARISVEPPRIAVSKSSGAPEHSTSGQAVPDGVDLLFAGQLIRGKGLQLLLRAMAVMRSQRTLDVVGSGNMEPRLKELAAKLGVAPRVRWRGFQPDASAWMRAAQCVVVPSFWQEPYGLVAAEAAALGRQVVAFAVGGLPEACAGRATLVPPGDVHALASALDSLPTSANQQ